MLIFIDVDPGIFISKKDWYEKIKYSKETVFTGRNESVYRNFDFSNRGNNVHRICFLVIYGRICNRGKIFVA